MSDDCGCTNADLFASRTDQKCFTQTFMTGDQMLKQTVVQNEYCCRYPTPVIVAGRSGSALGSRVPSPATFRANGVNTCTTQIATQEFTPVCLEFEKFSCTNGDTSSVLHNKFSRDMQHCFNQLKPNIDLNKYACNLRICMKDKNGVQVVEKDEAFQDFAKCDSSKSIHQRSHSTNEKFFQEFSGNLKLLEEQKQPYRCSSAIDGDKSSFAPPLTTQRPASACGGVYIMPSQQTRDSKNEVVVKRRNVPTIIYHPIEPRCSNGQPGEFLGKIEGKYEIFYPRGPACKPRQLSAPPDRCSNFVLETFRGSPPRPLKRESLFRNMPAVLTQAISRFPSRPVSRKRKPSVHPSALGKVGKIIKKNSRGRTPTPSISSRKASRITSSSMSEGSFHLLNSRASKSSRHRPDSHVTPMFVQPIIHQPKVSVTHSMEEESTEVVQYATAAVISAPAFYHWGSIYLPKSSLYPQTRPSSQRRYTSKSPSNSIADDDDYNGNHGHFTRRRMTQNSASRLERPYTSTELSGNGPKMIGSFGHGFQANKSSGHILRGRSGELHIVPQITEAPTLALPKVGSTDVREATIINKISPISAKSGIPRSVKFPQTEFTEGALKASPTFSPTRVRSPLSNFTMPSSASRYTQNDSTLRFAESERRISSNDRVLCDVPSPSMDVNSKSPTRTDKRSVKVLTLPSGQASYGRKSFTRSDLKAMDEGYLTHESFSEETEDSMSTTVPPTDRGENTSTLSDLRARHTHSSRNQRAPHALSATRNLINPPRYSDNSIEPCDSGFTSSASSQNVDQPKRRLPSLPPTPKTNLTFSRINYAAYLDHGLGNSTSLKSKTRIQAKNIQPQASSHGLPTRKMSAFGRSNLKSPNHAQDLRCLSSDRKLSSRIEERTQTDSEWKKSSTSSSKQSEVIRRPKSRFEQNMDQVSTGDYVKSGKRSIVRTSSFKQPPGVIELHRYPVNASVTRHSSRSCSRQCYKFTDSDHPSAGSNGSHTSCYERMESSVQTTVRKKQVPSNATFPREYHTDDSTKATDVEFSDHENSSVMEFISLTSKAGDESKRPFQLISCDKNKPDRKTRVLSVPQSNPGKQGALSQTVLRLNEVVSNYVDSDVSDPPTYFIKALNAGLEGDKSGPALANNRSVSETVKSCKRSRSELFGWNLTHSPERNFSSPDYTISQYTYSGDDWITSIQGHQLQKLKSIRGEIAKKLSLKRPHSALMLPSQFHTLYQTPDVIRSASAEAPFFHSSNYWSSVTENAEYIPFIDSYFTLPAASSPLEPVEDVASSLHQHIASPSKLTSSQFKQTKTFDHNYVAAMLNNPTRFRHNDIVTCVGRFNVTTKSCRLGGSMNSVLDFCPCKTGADDTEIVITSHFDPCDSNGLGYEYWIEVFPANLQFEQSLSSDESLSEDSSSNPSDSAYIADTPAPHSDIIDRVETFYGRTSSNSHNPFVTQDTKNIRLSNSLLNSTKIPDECWNSIQDSKKNYSIEDGHYITECNRNRGKQQRSSPGERIRNQWTEYKKSSYLNLNNRTNYRATTKYSFTYGNRFRRSLKKKKNIYFRYTKVARHKPPEHFKDANVHLRCYTVINPIEINVACPTPDTTFEGRLHKSNEQLELSFTAPPIFYSDAAPHESEIPDSKTLNQIHGKPDSLVSLECIVNKQTENGAFNFSNQSVVQEKSHSSVKNNISLFDKNNIFSHQEREVDRVDESSQTQVQASFTSNPTASIAVSKQTDEPQEIGPRHTHYDPTKHGSVHSLKMCSDKVTTDAQQILKSMRDTIELLMQDVDALAMQLLQQNFRPCEAICEHLALLPDMLLKLLNHLHYTPMEADLVRIASDLTELVNEVTKDPMSVVFYLLEIGNRLHALGNLFGKDLIPPKFSRSVHAVQTKLRRMRIGYVTRQYFHVPQNTDELFTPYVKSRQLARLEQDCGCKVNLLHPEDPRAIYCPTDYRTIEVVYDERLGKPELFKHRLNYCVNPGRQTVRLAANIVKQIDGEEVNMKPDEAKEFLNCLVRPRYTDVRAAILSKDKRNF